MQPTTTKMLLICALSASLGGLTGYILGKVIVNELEKREEEEWREKYVEDLKKIEEKEGYTNEIAEEELKVIDASDYPEEKGEEPKKDKKASKKKSRKNGNRHTDYTKFAGDDKGDLSEIASHYQTSIVEEPKESEDIFIISDDDWADLNGHDKSSLTYYEKDDTLVEDISENIIPDSDSLVGSEALVNFGKLSNDRDIVYVRNNRTSIDYEIVRNRGSYQEIVMGLGEEEISKSNRKEKKHDDEGSEE